MNQVLVIANGLLGDRVRERVLPNLIHALGEGVDWYFTTGPHDATQRAREALRSGVSWLIAAGGDGTINEVVNGYFEDGHNIRPECPVSFLPFGSGNDCLRTLAVPLKVTGAIKSLAAGRSRVLDVGLATFVNPRHEQEQRVFVNFAEAGVGALLMQHLNSSRRGHRRAAYLFSAIRTALYYKPKRIDFRLDGVVHSASLLSFIVANGRFFGAGMECAPMALPDDGVLDVITIGEFGRLELMVKIRKLVHGKHLSEAKVTHHAVRYLEISSPDQVSVELDGDSVGTLPATFTVLPKALHLRC